MTLRSPNVPVPSTAADDPRVGHLLGRAIKQPDEANCVIIGFPVDEGVRRNGGRPGAALGPDAIRRCLYKMTPDAREYDAFVAYLERTVDLGDIEPTGDLETDQAALGRVVAPHLARGATVVVLGGGHETSFGHFLGYVEAGMSVHVVNWDAHPDVRPLLNGKGHSGSPFRQMLEHESKRCASYAVCGLNAFSTAKAHLDYLKEHGCRAIFRDDGISPKTVHELILSLRGDAFVSFDLDALSQLQAGSVSAPNAHGLGLQFWTMAADGAGANPGVRSIDIVELCPPLDRDDQTARVAALTVWCFWRGRLRPLVASS
jgi:formiminoglutamase